MLHHIEINVNNLDETRRFYDALLPAMGYNLYQQWDQGFSYKLDNYYIVFVQTEDSFIENTYHRKNTGLNHLAFRVGSKQEVDRLRCKLLSNGTHEIYANDYPFAGGSNHYAFYFEDPDRIKIEIVAEIKSNL